MKLILIILFAIGIGWWLIEPANDEITIYSAKCTNGIIIQSKLPLNNFTYHYQKHRDNLKNCVILPLSSNTYKINFYKSEIHYNYIIGGPRRFANCAIFNSENWRCPFEDGSGDIAVINGLEARDEKWEDYFSLRSWQYWYISIYWFLAGEGPQGAWLIPDQPSK